MADVQPHQQPVYYALSDNEPEHRPHAQHSGHSGGVVMPDFADFPSYSPPPSRPPMTNPGSASSATRLRPAAPIVSSPSRDPDSPSRDPDLQPSASVHASTTSLSSSINSASPTKPAQAMTVSPSTLPPSPPSSSGAPMSMPQALPAPQIPTTPQRNVGADIRRQISLNRPQLPRSFSLGGAAARRHQHMPVSPYAMTPVLQQGSPHALGGGPEPITPAEYALHIVFTQFVRHAEKKLTMCLSYSPDDEPPISSLLAAGDDPVFDKILASLGYIARQKPRPVIDAVMFWRKSKSEAASAAARQKANLQHLHHQHNQHLQVPGSGLRHKVSKSLSDRSPIHRHQSTRSPATPASSNGHNFGLHRHHNTLHNIPPPPLLSPPKTDIAQQADRKSLISIYILCRVLIEVVKQTSAEVLGEDMGDKLEEIVFRQIKSTDPNLLTTSVIRTANWNLFAELLGEMSHMRFASVSDRFIAELEKLKGEANVSKEQEVNVQLIIHGMKYLKLKVYPMDAFEDSADFMESISKFFAMSHGQRIKQAYCDVMNQLLLSIAGVVTAEVNHPTWVNAIAISYPRALSLVAKQRYWVSAFQLSCTLLCVAPAEFFTENWIPLIESNYSKLKDRNCRTIVITGITRLLWVYLRRCTESLNNATKRLDSITKALFAVGAKKPWLTAESGVVGGCVQMIRFIGSSHPEYALKNIIFPLLSSEILMTMSENNMAADHLSPERMLVGIRSFLTILTDAAGGVPPPFYGPAQSSKESAEVEEKQPNTMEIQMNPLFKEYYHQFSAVLGKIMLICDSNFGGQAVLDEKLGHTPKTPSSAFSFSNNVNTSGVNSSSEMLHANYELLLTVFEAIPKCIPQSVSFGRIVEILCKGTAHPDSHVSQAAINALKSLAGSCKYPVQPIVTGFARFIFNYEERYSSTAVGDGLGTLTNVESTLKLYVELLNIWIRVIRQKTAEHREAGANGATGNTVTPMSTDSSRGEEMETTSVWSVIEEVESNGLFFLCSQSRAVRLYAIAVLRLIREFDSALDEQVEVLKMQQKRPASNGHMSRIIDVLEAPDGCGILSLNATPDSMMDSISVAEKVRLMRLLQESNEAGRFGILVRLAQSESGIDSALWLRMLPKFMTTCLAKFPMPVALCRDSVCGRLLHLHRQVTEIADAHHKASSPLHAIENYQKHSMRTGPEVLIEQWKLYLIVACCTLTATDDQDSTPSVSQTQQRRKGPPTLVLPYKRITSARALFKVVIPLLQVEYGFLREAVIAGLGCININLYKALIDSLQPMMASLSDGRKGTTAYNGQPPGSPSGYHWRRNRKHDGMRVAVTHVLQLTSHFLKEESIYSDSWILGRLVTFVKDTKNFLSQNEVQIDWECQKLRRYFCGLMQTLYEGIQRTSRPTKWLPFEARVSLFKMIEEWCGYGQYAHIAHERSEKMRRHGLEQCRNVAEQGVLMASMEVEKGQLELTALNAMASILDGPLTETIESHGSQAAVISFDVTAIFTWSHAVFQSPAEKMHAVGCRAIVNMLKANREHKAILAKTILFCYSEGPGARASENYFFAVADVLIDVADYPCEMRQPIALGLFKIGDEKSAVRLKAAALLKAVETRFFGKSNVQDYEISISDRTTAVYKRAEFNLSNQFALEYDELKYPILSELTMFFSVVSPVSRRDILAILIPWISTVELQLDPNGKDPSPSAYMVMTNLFDITVRFSNKIQNEIEALWVTLASARHLGNVRAILDFLINTSVEKRDPAFVEYGKQVVVYLASTPAGAKLVEALVAYIQPTSMLQTRGDIREYPGIEDQFPYVADLSVALPPSNRQIGFSIGQLAMILLVDLLVSPVAAMSEHLPLLLHVVFVLLDHYNHLVQEQARELLVHLIHELILSTDADVGGDRYNATAEFIDVIRRRDSQTLWLYDDLYVSEATMRTPKNMDLMIKKVFEIFAEKNPNLLRAEWSRTALTWATTCPVRHFACRSFQIFRSSFISVDQNMIADMLVRLSNTIADVNPDIQNFAMQILMTLNAISMQIDVAELVNYPQIFWATIACLQTIHQQEFIEGMTILETLLDKFSFSDPDVVSLFMSVFPPKWEGKFDGLQRALLPGLRSSKSYEQTLRVLDKLNALELNEITGDHARLLHAILANLPRFMHALDTEELSAEVVQAAEKLSSLAEIDGLSIISRIMTSLAKGRFRMKYDFVRQLIHALQATIFAENEASIMVCLLGFLSNKIDYVRIETMECLKYLFPLIDMRRPEFVAIGADLISPLLRLLQTEYAEQALQVLDEATYIPGTEMDKHVLRASLGGQSASATNFGVPNEDGWSVPNPSVRAAITRNNVHAVFYSCDVSKPEYQTLDPTMDVQFSREEYGFTGHGSPERMRHNPSQLASGMAEGGYFGGAFGISSSSSTSGVKSSYFGLERSDTMASYAQGEDMDGQLSHMVAALDNLNSFFAEEPAAYTNVLE
ncbi:cell morphogenesis N-terminal-domain-containing protein [Lipomyces tetrasporus]|uniref:Cell morphogenesis N-terminal-domain-containing protein n=1 Tax=Lipomyces tetrasporus TaxID=54092 RepID=A0AAD7QN09_9ASCO|nr:cell morphogenesis N-terminal-domain-containing protein [Lipomyces tetrasporus]KAJ8098254.1 cell morphogenesis N-terminal-domain-containing protein [Lipomyces tetrasporus]